MFQHFLHEVRLKKNFPRAVPSAAVFNSQFSQFVQKGLSLCQIVIGFELSATFPKCLQTKRAGMPQVGNQFVQIIFSRRFTLPDVEQGLAQ